LAQHLKTEFDHEFEAYYDAMIERIQDLRSARLPSDWDGIYRATSK
jgi:hypothetical protein